MSEPVQLTKFRCGTCLHLYDTRDAADLCESRPVCQDKGANVGDVVRITAGDGAGELATVETRFVIDRGWGHYAWDTYWHTVGLSAKLNKGWGHRMLTFDSYETVSA
jgi:hypothetical protein